MLEHLFDREMAASVAGDTTSTDLDETVNKSGNEIWWFTSLGCGNVKVFSKIDSNWCNILEISDETTTTNITSLSQPNVY
jgi:hypothetical protein